MSDIITTTYEGPDLDGYSCSVAYAELLRALGKDAKAHIWGEPQLEVQWILKKFDLEQAQGPIENYEGLVVILDMSDPDGLPGNIKAEQVIEIIDHRKITFEDRFPNATSQIEQVGAAATLVAERFRSANIQPSKESGLLLYGGILSNTQNLSSTATERDRQMAEWLKELSGASDNLAQEMFAAKSDLAGDELQKTLLGDSKVIPVQNKMIGTMQLEIIGAKELVKNRLQEIQQVLENFGQENDCDYAFVNIKDLENDSGIIITFDQETLKLMQDVPGIEWHGNLGFSSQLTLRKQITAWIDERLANS
ncbi:MAG: DHHA2 domain-containing protein [Patescibacteria group bacterium]|nr:DHH family phosphoesterase [Patescibacteria group bacterium]